MSPPDSIRGETPPGIDIAWLWTEARPQIATILRRARIPFEDAEDLVHDTLTKLLVREEEIRDPAAWLISTLRFEVLAYWRLKRAWLVEQLDQDLVRRLAAPVRDTELLCDLDRCLGELSASCQEIIRQRYILGVEPVELAPKMGYTTRGVRKLTRSCLSRLADRLADKPSG